jgi:hypothetical protein
MNFAIVENDKVTNVIVADTKEIAEAVTNAECVECDGSFWIGWTRVDGEWIQPKPETDPAI